jgi:hypothetical protein
MMALEGLGLGDALSGLGGPGGGAGGPGAAPPMNRAMRRAQQKKQR